MVKDKENSSEDIKYNIEDEDAFSLHSQINKHVVT